MSMTRPFLLVTLVGLAVALPARAAGLVGVEVVNGDKYSTAVDRNGDVDCYLMEVPAGSALSVSVKASKGSDLLPDLTMQRPDGSDLPVDALGLGGKKASLKKFVISETGQYGICIGGLDGTSTGGYDAVFKLKATKKVIEKAVQVGTSAVRLIEFPGADGALISVTVKVKGGAGLDDVRLLDPEGDEILAGSVVAKGTKKFLGKKLTLNSGFGDYAVEMTGSAGGATEIDCIVKIKFPKLPKVKAVLGVEPFIDNIAPSQGKDGDTVTLNGENFDTGAQVIFGDVTLTSGQINRVSDTQITFTAPTGASGDEDGKVDVGVQNPDGQVGLVQQGFTFLGVPVLGSVDRDYLPLDGNLGLTILGANFRNGATVTVGGTPATNVNVVNGVALTCTAPAHAKGAVDIVVTDEFERDSDPLSGLEYVDAAVVTSASPSEVPSHGGMQVTLNGSGFRDETTIKIAGEDATVVSQNGSSLTFVMPSVDRGEPTIITGDEFGQTAQFDGPLEATRSFHNVSEDAVPAAPTGTDFFSTTMAIGDLDGDDVPDLVLALRVAKSKTGGGYYSGSRILMNDGNGIFSDVTGSKHATFTEDYDYGQATSVQIGQLDADSGWEVLLVRDIPTRDSTLLFYYEPEMKNAKYYYSSTYPNDYRSYQATRLLDNDGNGDLSDDTDTQIPDSGSTPLFQQGERWQGWTSLLGDVDDDDDLDLIVTQSSARTVFYGSVDNVFCFTTCNIIESAVRKQATRVLLNDGYGNFSHNADGIPARNGNEDWDGSAIALGHFDNDGYVDLVIVRDKAAKDGDDNEIIATRILLGDGTGDFTQKTDAMPAVPSASDPGSTEWWQGVSVAVGDIDDDDDDDLIIGKGSVDYWYSDIDNEYKLLPAIRIFENDGYANFTEVTSGSLASNLFETGGPATLLSCWNVHLGDLDQDNDLDLVTVGSYQGVSDFNNTGYGYRGILPSGDRMATRIFLNDGAANFTDVTDDWFPAAANGDYLMATSSALGDLDEDGDLDLILGYFSNPNTDDVTSGDNRPLRVLENR